MHFVRLTPSGLAATLVTLVGFGCGPEPDPANLTQLTDLPGDETQAVFSPLGDRVAFTSDERGNDDIRIVDVETHAVTDLVATVANESEPRWSPDGSQLSFLSDDGGASAAWIVSAHGGEPRRLTDRATRTRWSPDGEWITYARQASGNMQTWIVRPDGSGARQLTGPGEEHVPYGWSPDGRYVLVLEFGETQNVFGVPIDGDDWIQITTREGEEWWPQWSPDGNHVAFYSTWDNEMTEVWTADVATQTLTRITDLPVEDFRPQWSPDGAWIAYSSDRVSKSGVWLSSADGTVAIPVATDGRAGGLYSWSLDGHWLAFSYVRSKEGLYAIAHNAEPETITDGSQNVLEAVASPDGNFIAFESEDVGTEADLFLFDVVNGTTSRLTEEITYNSRPSWSPDGTQLTFERSLGGGPRTNHVGVVDVSTGAIRELTDHGYVRQPVWCGVMIVYTREHSRAAEGPDQLWAVPAAGGTPIQLTESPGNKRTTDCSPSGAVLFTADEDAGRVQWQAQLRDNGRLSDLVMIAEGEGGRWSPDETRIVLLSTKDGAPDIYVVPGGGGGAVRVTNTPIRESWPDWLGDRIIYGANLRGRDVWIADVQAIIAREME